MSEGLVLFLIKSHYDGVGFHHDSLEFDDEESDCSKNMIFCEMIRRDQLQKQQKNTR